MSVSEFFLNSSPSLIHHKEQDSYSRSWSLNVVAMMMEATRTAEMLVLLFQSIYHKPPENNSLQSHHNHCSRLLKIMLLNYMVFCIDLLLFFLPTSWILSPYLWVHLLNSMVIQLKFQWSYWIGSKGSVSVCILWTVCVCVKCCLRHTHLETEFLYSCFALRTVNEHMKGHLAVVSKWVCKQTCHSL